MLCPDHSDIPKWYFVLAAVKVNGVLHNKLVERCGHSLQQDMKHTNLLRSTFGTLHLLVAGLQLLRQLSLLIDNAQLQASQVEYLMFFACQNCICEHQKDFAVLSVSVLCYNADGHSQCWHFVG